MYGGGGGGRKIGNARSWQVGDNDFAGVVRGDPRWRIKDSSGEISKLSITKTSLYVNTHAFNVRQTIRVIFISCNKSCLSNLIASLDRKSTKAVVYRDYTCTHRLLSI